MSQAVEFRVALPPQCRSNQTDPKLWNILLGESDLLVPGLTSEFKYEEQVWSYQSHACVHDRHCIGFI